MEIFNLGTADQKSLESAEGITRSLFTENHILAQASRGGVLDVGCGSGIYTLGICNALAKMGINSRILGIDRFYKGKSTIEVKVESLPNNLKFIRGEGADATDSDLIHNFANEFGLAMIMQPDVKGYPIVTYKILKQCVREFVLQYKPILITTSNPISFFIIQEYINLIFGELAIVRQAERSLGQMLDNLSVNDFVRTKILSNYSKEIIQETIVEVRATYEYFLTTEISVHERQMITSLLGKVLPQVFIPELDLNSSWKLEGNSYQIAVKSFVNNNYPDQVFINSELIKENNSLGIILIPHEVVI